MSSTRVLRSSTQVGARAAAMAAMLALLSCTRAARPNEAAAPAPVANCDTTTGYHVIIVGAGMSGLTAAKELRRGRPDINVLVLEATDRIGGRARTLKQGPLIDLGGAWLHGIATNQLTGIVDTLGFKRVTTRLEEAFFTESGRSGTDQARAFWAANEIFEKVMGQAARDQLTRQTCAEFLSSPGASDISKLGLVKWDQLELQKEFCRHVSQQPIDSAKTYLPTTQDPNIAALLAANAGPLESASEAQDTSVIDASEFEADDDALLEKGLGTFVEAYGREVPVCINSPVTKITYSDGGVVVEVAGGKRYEASKALVTVSTGVLRAKKIEFEPELPTEKLDAIQNLPMGHLQKVIIDFKEQEGLLPEQDANSWLLYVDSNHSVMAFVIRPLNKNIAIGFYGGEQARRFEEQCKDTPGERPLPPERQPCDAQAIKRAQEALGKMYSQAVNEAVEKADIYVTRWSLEPWTLGAYSAAAPDARSQRKDEALSAREQLAKPLPYRQDTEGTASHQVFFAGEACASPMYNGSLAGAYESGLKAARQMLQEL